MPTTALIIQILCRQHWLALQLFFFDSHSTKHFFHQGKITQKMFDHHHHQQEHQQQPQQYHLKFLVLL